MCRLMKREGIIVILCLLCLAFAGCGKKKENSLKAQVAEFEAGIPKASADTSENKGIVVGSVNMGMNGEWFGEVMNGIRGAAADLGVEVKMLDSNSDLSVEAQNVDTLLKEGIDALVISPIDVNASAVPIQKVLDAGIPVVAWNTTVNADVNTSVGVVPSELGAGTGEYACQYIKTHGLKEVHLMIIGNTSYEIGIARCDGFKAAIQDLVDQGTITVSCEGSGETREQGAEEVKKLLGEHPEVDMIWAWNQGALHGAADALKELGKKDIVVLGVDMSMELADDMLADKIDLEAVTTQLPYNMGYKAVVNAVDAAKGVKTEKKIWIPVSTYVKSEKERLEQYKENHKDLVE